MGERADRELVESARRGDREAIGELFSRYWRAARAAAFGVTGEWASAEDAASEAFRLALAGMHSLQDPERFGAWLRTIVVRQARSAVPGRHSAADALADVLTDPSERPDSVLERLELAAVVQQAVRGLPDRLREAMALVYFEGYDTAAAARFLDIPGGTLRRRLHDGRTRLRAAVEQILQEGARVGGEHDHQIEILKTMIDEGRVYEAFRGALALRPPPAEWIRTLMRPRTTAAKPSPVDSGDALAELRPETAERLLRPSARASDPKHPVGSVTAAIRSALPGFQEWPFDAGEAARVLSSFTTGHGEAPQPILPPGAEGRPGSFLRATRALVRPSECGPAQTIYQVLQQSPDEQAFRAAIADARISDVLDLIWMTAGPVELRMVQELLERVASAVLPGAAIRISAYDEPRYRSALQLHAGGSPARAAYGGVLREWPGRPREAGAAHLRIFLEPWAAVRSGQTVELEPLPGRP